jgi:addiction module RelB/DinJ family antitoxin
MQETTIHIKTDTATRDRAKQVAEDFGMTLTALVNAMLKQVSRTKKLELSMDETPSPWMIEALRESEADEKAGRVSPVFAAAHDAIAWLDDPNASYANGDKVHNEI